jgi:hypothetical protein
VLNSRLKSIELNWNVFNFWLQIGFTVSSSLRIVTFIWIERKLFFFYRQLLTRSRFTGQTWLMKALQRLLFQFIWNERPTYLERAQIVFFLPFNFWHVQDSLVKLECNKWYVWSRLTRNKDHAFRQWTWSRLENKVTHEKTIAYEINHEVNHETEKDWTMRPTKISKGLRVVMLNASFVISAKRYS